VPPTPRRAPSSRASRRPHPCSRTAPCKTFAGAISKTFINGEINCLDPGGYGPVTITKSITIDCKGTNALILAVGNNGITVSIPASADRSDPLGADPRAGHQRRRRVGSVGTRTGLVGIRATAGTSLFVEDTVIEEFTQQGIQVQTSAAFNLSLDRVLIRNTKQFGRRAVGQRRPGRGIAQQGADLRHVDRADAVRLGARQPCATSRWRTTPAASRPAASPTSSMPTTSWCRSPRAAALQANPTGTIRVANSVITQNATGLNANSGSDYFDVEHSVTGNTADGAFTSTTAAAVNERERNMTRTLTAALADRRRAHAFGPRRQARKRPAPSSRAWARCRSVQPDRAVPHLRGRHFQDLHQRRDQLPRPGWIWHRHDHQVDHHRLHTATIGSILSSSTTGVIVTSRWRERPASLGALAAD
jgi:hypothetical protein